MASLNKHFRNELVFDRQGKLISTRRGPTCQCGAPWAPVCPTKGCEGRTEPMRVIRTERGYFDNVRAAHAGERVRR